MPSRKAVPLLLLAVACATAPEVRTAPQVLPPFIPLGGPSLARLEEPVDYARFQPTDGFRFGILGARSWKYYVTRHDSTFNSTFTAVGLDETSRVACIVAHREVSPEAALDSLTRLFGRPRFTQIEHQGAFWLWWDNTTLLSVFGWVGADSHSIEVRMRRLPPGEHYEPDLTSLFC